jgi:hypothetical protein
MDLPESQAQSFVLRIWVEQTAEEAGRVLWRGHITHVKSGERCYVTSVEEIVAFLARHLASMGILGEPRRGLKRWLRRWAGFGGGGR